MQNGQWSPTERCFSCKTGVRQGCILSLFLFLLAIDWVLKQSTAQGGNGIQWTSWVQLDDLDFAGDLALLVYTQQQVQEKTSMVTDNSAHLGLKGKSKVSRITQHPEQPP